MKKVTILTAAGFNMPPNYGGISTGNLTQSVRASNPMAGRFQIAGTPPGEYFYNLLFNYYDAKMAGTPTLRDVNFETIVYLVEEIFSFYSDQGDHNPPGMIAGISGSFSEIIDAIDTDIIAAAANINMDKRTFLKQVYNALLKPIIDIVGVLDGNNAMTGMIDFNNRMLNGVFKDWTKRIYTLNYDTWLTTNAGYYDGFENGNFESDKVYSNRDIDCHYNLHGSVRWRPNIDEDRIEKLNHVVDVFGYGTGDYQTINRQPIIPSPIITGYNKSSRLDLKPYIAIHHSFLSDILQSDYLLVVGYGGGDPHINEIINTFKGRVLIIDFFSKWLNVINAGGVFDPFDDEMREQLFYNINPYSNGWDRELNWATDDFVKSNDSRISVWWKGLTNDLYTAIPNLNI